MKRSSIFQLFIITLGLIAGGYFSNRAFSLHQQSEHAVPMIHNMDHGNLDVSQDAIIPEIVKLEITKDKMSGWNLLIHTKNFRFTPENVNQKNKAGEGHAHLYINGEKFARIYSPSFHIPKLIGTDHEIRITLNANGHETLAVGNVPIEKVISLSSLD